MRVLCFYRTILLTGALSASLFLLSFYVSNTPRVLAVNEVPIAFWAWRTREPKTAEVQKAFAATNAKTLFLRTGQFDLVNGEVQRIRPAVGPLPASVELHLVYNGTRRFLGEWEKVEPTKIAERISDTFKDDLARAQNEHANVGGIQLDFDSPEHRLLNYAQVLKRLHELLPADIKLSITGLPAWLSSPEIPAVLAKVDFWIPQCYGAAIPTSINQHIPIASPSDVAKTVAKVRELNKPFWAGLSAYSYAILYGTDGQLIELRGDIDPASASHVCDLELVESTNFPNKGITGERRYVYHVKNDLVLDGLIMKAGESLVFDLPNADSLRASARAVRENGGEALLGICIFRLPSTDDEATLTSGEIAAALSDRQAKVSTAIELENISDKRIELHAANRGNAAAAFGDGALTIDLPVPAGSITGVPQISGFTGYETLCQTEALGLATPCSSLRANVVRLKADAWRPGDTASVTFIVKSDLPDMIHAEARSRISSTYISIQSLDLQLNQSEKIK
jgi:hypothetical protein